MCFSISPSFPPIGSADNTPNLLVLISTLTTQPEANPFWKGGRSVAKVGMGRPPAQQPSPHRQILRIEKYFNILHRRRIY
ncbi:MAG: hypothetical protein AAFN12_17925, partial [Cyanobacteria bacterium J06560_2]